MPYHVILHHPSAPAPKELVEEMFRLRREVFADRHGWSVNTRGGLERDVYDLMTPVYGLCVHSSGRLEGCWRIMPTTGPNLLHDVPAFVDLVDGPLPKGPQVWECTRFAIRNMTAAGGHLSTVTGMLLEAMLETGLDYGITEMAAVCELPFERLLKRCGIETIRYGAPQRIGKAHAVAGYFAIDHENLERVRQRCGLSGMPADNTDLPPALRTPADDEEAA